MKPYLFLVPVLLLASTGLVRSQQYRRETLPSGRTILFFEDETGRNGFGLELTYKSDLKADGHNHEAALRKEVDEIWPILKRDAERLKLRKAVIHAEMLDPEFKVSRGGPLGVRSTIAYFRREGDDSWSRMWAGGGNWGNWQHLK